MKSDIVFIEILTPLDWIIFALVLVATFIAVIYGDRLKKKSDDSNSEHNNFLDLLIMGRQLTLPLFIATLVATWYGGIFGVTEIAFNKGIYNFITQGAFWYVSYLIFAFFIIHRITKYQAVTLPNLIGKMFGPYSEKLSALFNFFNVMPIAYVISLGLFLQLLFGGQLAIWMFVGVTITVLYSMFGGFRAVVFSDLVQFFVMCLGVFLVLFFSVTKFGGLSYLQAQLPPGHFDPMGGQKFSTMLVWGFIALSTLVDPNFYQRCFAAQGPGVAKKGIIISTIIWIAFDICTTGGAMYAKAVLPEAQSGHAYLTYGLQILPSGLRGFLLAGVLATVLSTLDSYLFLAGTTLAYDLAPNRLKGNALFHHAGIVLVGVAAVVLALIFEGNIKQVWKTLGSYSASCMLLPVIYGHLFPRKISDRQFVFACALGVIATTYWRNVNHSGFWADLDELYAGITATTVGLAGYGAFRKIGLIEPNQS